MRILSIACLAVTLASCSGPTETSETATASGTPVVQATNYPLAYFAEKIGGDAIEVKFLAPADGDPAFWKPTPEQISEMQQADLILTNGATYEKWLTTASLPESVLVDTSASYQGDLIEVIEAGAHSHGGEGEHSHAGTAFTTWMDLSLAQKQAAEVRSAILKLLPDDAHAVKDQIKANAANLMASLQSLDADFQAVGTEIGDKPLVASHPVYQYFANRYGLNIDSVLWEPETVPDEAAMAELQKKLVDHDAKSMLWEGDPAPESVEKLKAIEIESIVIDPCGNRPEEGDWLRVMQQNLLALKGLM